MLHYPWLCGKDYDSYHLNIMIVLLDVPKYPLKLVQSCKDYELIIGCCYMYFVCLRMDIDKGGHSQRPHTVGCWWSVSLAVAEYINILFCTSRCLCEPTANLILLNKRQFSSWPDRFRARRRYWVLRCPTTLFKCPELLVTHYKFINWHGLFDSCSISWDRE